MVHRRVNAPFAWWRYISLPSDRVLDRALDALEEEVGAMVRATRERIKAEPERRHAPTNFLEAIVGAVETGDSGFTDAEIFANAGTLLLAGEDTTANSMAWMVHYFTKYPEHFERVRREVDNACRARIHSREPGADEGASGPRRVLQRGDAPETRGAASSGRDGFGCRDSRLPHTKGDANRDAGPAHGDPG